MGPYFRQVEWIEGCLFSLLLGHYLYLQRPLWKVFPVNGLNKVALRKISIYPFHVNGFVVGEVLNTLQGFKMEFHIYQFIFIVDHGEGMAAKSVHVAMAMWCAPVAHKYHYLVQAFGVQAPEVPHHGWAFTIGTRVSFLGMYKVAEFLWVLYKENRGIVSYQVPVTIFRIKFYCKPAWVSFCIRAAFFTAYGAETEQQFRLLAYLIEDLCFGVF